MSILSELSDRLFEINRILGNLHMDFQFSRKPNIQIRKDSQKCVNESAVIKARFARIANNYGLDETDPLGERFMYIATQNTSLSTFFI